MKRYKQKEEHDPSRDDKKHVEGQDTSKSSLGKSHCMLKPKSMLRQFEGNIPRKPRWGRLPYWVTIMC